MLYITVLGFFQILIFIPSKVWVFLGFCFLQWHQILMINYFFVKKIKILKWKHTLLYHENKYPAERNSRTKPNISPTPTEHVDHVPSPHITFCSGKKIKTKLAIITVSLLTHCCPLPYPNTVLNEYACTPNINCTIDW